MTYTLQGHCRYLAPAPWLRVKTTILHTAKLPFVSSALCGTEDTAATKRSPAAAPAMPTKPAGAGQPPGRSCVLEGWVLPSEAGRPRREGLLQGPALGIPYLDEALAEQRGVNAARHLRSERHRAVPAAEPPAPPQAAHLGAARGHRQRQQQHRQQQESSGSHDDSRPEQRAGAALPRKEGREGGRTAALLRAVQRGCARGLRASG